MANPWFKFYGIEYLGDQKILQLNGNERSCWLTLLCYASQTTDGVIRFLSEKQLLLMSGVHEDISVIKKFEDLQMIELCNGDVTVKNWTKRQYSESINRVREYRLKQKFNAQETTEKKREDKKRIEDIEWLNKKSWEEWVQHRKEIGKKLTPLAIKKQLTLLEKHKADHVTMIERSIQNSWSGLFPLSEKNKPRFAGNDYARENRRLADRVEEIDYANRNKIENEIKNAALKMTLKN